MKFGEGVAARGFKKKTIEEVISNKINHWVKLLLPKEENESDEIMKLRNDIIGSYILTGGAITSMLQGYEPNDFDVYFSNTQIAEKVAKLYIEKFSATDKISKIETRVIGTEQVQIYIESAGILSEGTDLNTYQYFESMTPSQMQKYFKEHIDKEKNTEKKYKIAYMSSNAITLTDDIQIVLRFVGPPEEIHKNYDFIHCTNYYTEATGLVVNNDALLSTLSKELKYVGSKYPVCSMFRLKKFINRGWTITAGEMLKIAYDISKLNLNDMNVLQEQLVGVDAEYFLQLIEALKEKEDISRTYLFETINRVFDSHKDNME